MRSLTAILMTLMATSALAADPSASSLRTTAVSACHDYNAWAQKQREYERKNANAQTCRSACNPLIQRCVPCYIPVREAEEADSAWNTYQGSRSHAERRWNSLSQASKAQPPYRRVKSFIDGLPRSRTHRPSTLSCTL